MSTHEQPEPWSARSGESLVERRIAERARLLNEALNSIEDFAYVFDRSGRFLYSNEALLRSLDISPADIIGKDFLDLGYPPDLAAKLQQQIQRVLETKEVVRDAALCSGPAGKTGFYEYIFSPVFAPDGTVDAPPDRRATSPNATGRNRDKKSCGGSWLRNGRN